MNPENIYPRTNDHETVCLKNVIKNPNILVGDFTMYNDFVYDPRQFEKNNVLYHYPINHDKLIIGKFCSIACGAKFLFTSANHTQASLSTYPFPIFFEEWGLGVQNITSAWDNKGDIIIGNDVWIGYEAVILYGEDKAGPWVTKTDMQTLNEYIKPIIHDGLNVQGLENLNAYLYGDEMAAMQNYPCVGLPYCAGYACGYHLVKHYLKKTGKSIIEATLLPASEILETVEDFWNE